MLRAIFKVIWGSLKLLTICILLFGTILDTYILWNVMSVIIATDEQINIQNVLIYRLTNLGERNKVDKDILQASIAILNKTQGVKGSGTIVRLTTRGVYVLTCGHLFNNMNDEIVGTWFFGDREKELKLRLIALDTDKDLALLKISGVIPKKISTVPIRIDLPAEGSITDVVGNPGNHRNLATIGTLLAKSDCSVYLSNVIGYGSSGGGVFNEGDLIGVISEICPSKSQAIAVNTYCIQDFIDGYFEGKYDRR